MGKPVKFVKFLLKLKTVGVDLCVYPDKLPE